MPTAQQVQQAWKALRRTRRRIGTGDGRARLPGGISGRHKRSGPSYSGYRPAEALSRLVADGWDQPTADAALHEAVVARFPSFANSWDSYIDNQGFFWELMQLSEDEREKLSAPLKSLKELVDGLKHDPVTLLSDLPRLYELSTELSQLSRCDRPLKHPALALMTQRYGLHTELAHAVLLHARAVPWWVHLLLPLFVVAVGFIFVLALVDPHNQGFENVGGVSWVHYTVLPLFMVAFAAVEVWLIRDAPRRAKAWREQLARYERVWGQEHT